MAHKKDIVASVAALAIGLPFAFLGSQEIHAHAVARDVGNAQACKDGKFTLNFVKKPVQQITGTCGTAFFENGKPITDITISQIKYNAFGRTFVSSPNRHAHALKNG